MGARGKFQISVLAALFLLCGILGCAQSFYPSVHAFKQDKRAKVIDKIRSAKNSEVSAKKQFSATIKTLSSVDVSRDKKSNKVKRQLEADLNKCGQKATSFIKRIATVENATKEFLRDWEDELDLFSNEKLRRASELKLEKTRQQCEEVVHLMKSAGGKIEPAIIALSDYLLFLKHNLSSYTATSLEEEMSVAVNKTNEVIATMDASIVVAEKFITILSSEI